MTDQTVCLNCGSPVVAKYCPASGQKTATAGISLGTLAHEVPHAIFHVDRGLVPAIKALFTEPARLITEFLRGRRIVYFNPLTLLVLCSTGCATLWIVFPFKPELFRGADAVDPRVASFLSYWFKVVGASQLV